MRAWLVAAVVWSAAPAALAATEPPATDSAPAATDSAPAATDSAPAATDSAPAATDSAPAATDSAPAATDSAPAATDSAPAANDAAAPTAIDAAAPAATEPAAPAATDAAAAELTAPAPSAARRFFDELVWGTRSWRDGSPRFFFAEQMDVGYVYVRARSWLGYGKPHDVWGGLEVNPLLGQGGLGVFVGLAGGARYVTARAGVRPFMSSERPFLPAADAHDRIEFNLPGSSAKYLALEAEVTGEVRLGPGRLSVLASLTRVEGVPEGLHVYEETLRIIVEPPWVWRARGEYALFVVGGQEHNVGLVVDVFGVPARDMVQVRAGVVARLVLSPQLEARLSLIPTVYSGDRLGLVTSDFTELGFRWRFATGR